VTAKCFACTLNEPDAPAFTAAQGAMLAVALGHKLEDFCAVHRTEMGRVRAAAERGWAMKKMAEFMKVWRSI
jgi:hypothetical protein